MIEWLHWGGNLIVSGPLSLDALRGSFLDEYLPATTSETTTYDVDSLAELNSHWSVTDNAGVPQALRPAAPLSGVRLVKREGAEFFPGTGDLVAERRVGRGRIVVTAVRLADPALLSWRSYDGFFNACMLARPPRRFDFNQGRFLFAGARRPIASIRRSPAECAYFSRDADAVAGMPHTVVPADLSNATLPTGQAVPFNAGMSTGRTMPPGGMVGGMIGVTDTEIEQFETFKTQSGMAAWNDFSHASSLASKTLREAAGIAVPKRQFVLWMVGIYLLLIVPVNWLIFRLAGRVEWAWAAVPVLAVGWAAVVIWFAQLDIGFAPLETEIAIMEVQNGFPRAHLTRYTALYSSLSTTYDCTFDDRNAVAQPFSVDVRMLHGQSHPTVVLRHDGEPFLSDVVVSSNSTGMVHSEQMFDLGGQLVWQAAEGTPPSLENNTKLPLSGVAIVRRNAGANEWAWLGELPAGKRVDVQFETFDAEARQEVRDASPMTRSERPEGGLNLRHLIDFAEDHKSLESGEVRLVGWRDDALPGVRVEPAAAQSRRATLVVANLALPSRDPERDVNLYSRVVPANLEERPNGRPRNCDPTLPENPATKSPALIDPTLINPSPCPHPRPSRASGGHAAMIELIDFGKTYGDFMAVDSLESEDRGRRIVRLHRAQRRRQEHHDPLSRHAAQGHARRGNRQRSQCHEGPARACAKASATCPTTSASTTA